MIRDPEQFAALLAEVRAFVQTECLPLEQQIDRTDEIPEALVERMREIGLFGHSIPEAYGGAGLTHAKSCRSSTSRSRRCATTFRARFGGNTGIASESLVVDGTEAQKGKLPAAARERRDDRLLRADRAGGRLRRDARRRRSRCATATTT